MAEVIALSEYVHLCLTDLLDADLSSQEYFNSLPNRVRQRLIRKEISTFEELQECARRILEEQEQR